MGVGMAVVGVLTIALVSGGFNDMWFALAASAPLSVLSAVGVGNLAAAYADRRAPGSRSPAPHPIVAAFVLGALAALPVALVWGTGAYAVGGWRWAGPLLGLALAIAIAVSLGLPTGGALSRWRRVVGLVLVASVAMSVFGRPLYLLVERVMAPQVAPHDTRTYAPVDQFVVGLDYEDLSVISSGQVDAGNWLRSSADSADLVATNVTYSPLVPALTGLRTWISGIHYQAPYGRPGAIDELLARERASWTFINEPSAVAVQPLCSAGVDWIWVDPRRTGTTDWGPWANVASRAPDVVILRVEPDACQGVLG